MKTVPNANPPTTQCQCTGSAKSELVELPTRFSASVQAVAETSSERLGRPPSMLDAPKTERMQQFLGQILDR